MIILIFIEEIVLEVSEQNDYSYLIFLKQLKFMFHDLLVND